MSNERNVLEVINRLYPKFEFSCDGAPEDNYPYATITAIKNKLSENEYNLCMAEFNKHAYIRKRTDEYPDMGIQLNKIYDDGLTKWKSEMIDPIKTKWPKDNSGPVE
tara:strand:- start:97 stop:417 length:321 start_codon:yes stop_codon:yes gene_type:complete